MSKRGTREGGIDRRSSDDRYAASTGIPDGKRRPFYGRTRSAVAQKLQKAQHIVSQGLSYSRR